MSFWLRILECHYSGPLVLSLALILSLHTVEVDRTNRRQGGERQQESALVFSNLEGAQLTAQSCSHRGTGQENRSQAGYSKEEGFYCRALEACMVTRKAGSKGQAGSCWRWVQKLQRTQQA